MPNDTTLRLPYATGRTLYVQVEAPDGTVRHGAAFEAFTTADWAGYAVAAAESPAGSGRYAVDFAALGLPAGDYTWTWFDCLAGPPVDTNAALTDPRISDPTSGYWDGETFVTAAAAAGSVSASLTGYTGLVATGSVADANPTARNFVVQLDGAPAVPAEPDWVGLTIGFTTGALTPAKATITGYRRLTTTTAMVTVGAAFSAAPANGDKITIL